MNKRHFLAVAFAIMICLPCLLVFDGGPDAANGHETLQWTNVFGFIWFGFLVLGGFKLITPKWMRDELKSYMDDED